MLDGLFNFFAGLLAFFYGAWPTYAGAIFLLTLAVNIVLTPLTLKATRSNIEMQRWAPEIKRIQKEHADNREEQSAAMMAFYKQHNINPLGGCLPQLVQAPIFIVLYNVMRGLFRKPGDSPTFEPKYLDSCCEDSALNQELLRSEEAVSWGFDLARAASSVLQESVVRSLPYLALILIVGASGWYQQRQIMGRSQNSAINPQQQMIMKFMPFFLPVISFTLPAGLVLYFVFGNLYRLAMQTFITRRYYGPDSDKQRELEDVTEAGKSKSAGGAAKAGAKATGAKAPGAKTNGAKTNGAAPKKGASKSGAAKNGAGGGGAAKSADKSKSKGQAKAPAKSKKPSASTDSGEARHGRRTDGGGKFTRRPRPVSTATDDAEPQPTSGRASRRAARSAAAEQPKATGSSPSSGGKRVTPSGTAPRPKRKKKK